MMMMMMNFPKDNEDPVFCVGESVTLSKKKINAPLSHSLFLKWVTIFLKGAHFWWNCAKIYFPTRIESLSCTGEKFSNFLKEVFFVYILLSFLFGFSFLLIFSFWFGFSFLLIFSCFYSIPFFLLNIRFYLV